MRVRSGAASRRADDSRRGPDVRKGRAGDRWDRRAGPVDLRTADAAGVQGRGARHRADDERRRRAKLAGETCAGRPQRRARLGGRHRLRFLYARGGPHRVRARPGGRPGQLCGHHPRRIAAKARQERVGRGALHQPRQRLQRDQAGHRRHDATRVRPNRQHLPPSTASRASSARPTTPPPRRGCTGSPWRSPARSPARA